MASNPDKTPLSECPAGQAPLSRVSDDLDKKSDALPRRKVIRINGLKKPDTSGQLRTNAIGARRTVVVCPYRADNCPAPSVVLLGMVSKDRLAAFMGCAHDIDRQPDRFLKEHCPDPALIRSAITRAQLWAVAEYLPDEMICRRGDRIRACWLVLSGQIEIRADDQTVAFRGAGELVGEQEPLHFLAGKTGARTADIKACGPRTAAVH
jgi:Cyclic nucleotide-binding domain